MSTEQERRDAAHNAITAYHAWAVLDPDTALHFVRMANQFPVTQKEASDQQKRIQPACVAVVRERLASEGRSLEDKLVEGIAHDLVYDLGMPWSPDRKAKATALETEAQAIIQLYWQLEERR